MRKFFSLFLVLIVSIMLIVGCSKNTEEVVDYSQYSFTNVSWTRTLKYWN